MGARAPTPPTPTPPPTPPGRHRRLRAPPCAALLALALVMRLCGAASTTAGTVVREVPTSAAPIAPAACDARMQRFYTELACEPLGAGDGEGPCPRAYRCGALAGGRRADRCYLRGEAFAAGQRAPPAASANPCVGACECRAGAPGAPHAFACAAHECPDVFGPPLPPGCVRLYRLDACCAVAHFCDDSGQPAPPQCELQGRAYLEGQYMFPEGDAARCKTCICQRGLNGSAGGARCRDAGCDVELLHGRWLRAGCAPVFYGDELCCPVGWRCPVDSDRVIPVFNGSDEEKTGDPSSTATPVVTTETSAPGEMTEAKTEAGAGAGAETGTEAEAVACVFGRLRVPVGARLSPGDNPCVRCWCSTPPLPTCQQAPHGSCGHHRTTTTATTTTPTTTTTSAPTTNVSTITPAPAAA